MAEEGDGKKTMRESIEGMTERNAHLRFEEYKLSAYVRKTSRWIANLDVTGRAETLEMGSVKVDQDGFEKLAKEVGMTATLEIGSVEVDEGSRGKGNFSRFLDDFEKLAKETKRIAYVECVLNPILEKELMKRNYTKTIDGENTYFMVTPSREEGG